MSSILPSLRFALLGCLALGVAPAMAEGPTVAAKHPVTETFFGTVVTDNYRWMEDMGSPAFQDFMKGQAAYTRSALDAIAGLPDLAKEVSRLDNSAPLVLEVQYYGGKYFYKRSAPGQTNYSLLMRDAAGGPETVLVDPSKLDHDGKHVSIDYFTPSEDARYVAYALSEGGSEQSTMHVLDTTTGKDLAERIDRTNFGGVSWLPDNKSFFYLRLKKLGPGDPATDKYRDSKSYLHRLGTDPEGDTPILGAGLSKEIQMGRDDEAYVAVTPGSAVAVATVVRGVKNEIELYTAPLAQVTGTGASWIKVAGFDDQVTNAQLRGNDLYLLTHKDASRFKVLKTDALKPDIKSAILVVPESKAVISSIGVAADALYIREMDGGPSRLRRLPYNAGVEAIPLPYVGSIDGLFTDPLVPGALFSFEGWIHARLWERFGPDGRIVDTGLQPPSPVDTSRYTSEEVTAKSDDGTAVPLSLVYSKQLPRDGSNPTLIWGYGAYGISETPVFAPRWFPLLDHGAVWATCHVRGGGEYGEDWHLAGKKLTKPNSWKDLIGCAKYLIANGFTSPGKIGIDGGSAGGILVGNAMTTRPDLFRVVIDEVGVSNALRSEFSENGPPNVPEYGSVTDAEGFKSLSQMDAIQHVKPGTAYPAMLLTTGINDPRVPSWESAKMAATVQAATSSKHPVLLRVDYDAGHGIGSTRTQRDKELADKFAFFFWQTGVTGFQPASSKP